MRKIIDTTLKKELLDAGNNNRMANFYDVPEIWAVFNSINALNINKAQFRALLDDNSSGTTKSGLRIAIERKLYYNTLSILEGVPMVRTLVFSRSLQPRALPFRGAEQQVNPERAKILVNRIP